MKSKRKIYVLKFICVIISLIIVNFGLIKINNVKAEGDECMKTVIITGANSGLGFETAKKIAKNKSFRVILACRNLTKGSDAMQKIKKETENENVKLMELNTASFKSIRKFAVAYEQSGYGSIYALLCNAGVSGTHTGITEDGFDVIFQTNHLGHFLLVNLLLPDISEDGLIFVTSSDMHDSPMKKMSWNGTEILAHPDIALAKDNIRYSYSKLCNLYFTYELANILKDSGSKIKVNAFNPGFMVTNFMPVSKESILFVKTNMPDRFGDLENSSSAYAQLVTEEGLVSGTGLYYDRSINPKKSSDLSYDKINARELWDKSLELTQLK